MSENSLFVVQSLVVLIVTALLMTWVLAVWLPGRTFKRWAKLGLAALLSLVGFQFARVGLMAVEGSFLTDMLQYFRGYGHADLY